MLPPAADDDALADPAAAAVVEEVDPAEDDDPQAASPSATAVAIPAAARPRRRPFDSIMGFLPGGGAATGVDGRRTGCAAGRLMPGPWTGETVDRYPGV